MAKKLQSYFIFKTTSKRLKNSNYDINITIEQARENGEIVSLGESQFIRSLQKIKGIEASPEYLNSLFTEKRKIKKRNPSFENYQKLMNVEKKIDDILFIPEIVSVVINTNSHYKSMIQNGFFINNKKYVRLLCGAGQSRRNTVLFICSEYEVQLKKILNNDRNADVEISNAKFNAYFALASSAALIVSEPYFCVINDCEIQREEEVEYIEETDTDDVVSQRRMFLDFNLFDGQGIISPKLAMAWASDLGLDYVPSTFVIRNAFMKGMVAVIDFHKFSDDMGTHIIKDVWGNDVNIRDMDLVLTASQLKLWNSYDSCSDYISKCRNNGFNFSVSKYAPKEDTRYVFSNYQFLQVLNLNNSQIESLCSRTIEYFEKTLGGDINFILMYLLGKSSNKGYDPLIFEKIGDNITKALILNNELIKDPYIHSHILRSLNKRIKESYIGNLLLDGNYQTMISDPYAFMEHLFGLPVRGLLDRGSHYSSYWNKRRTKVVVACRAPLTWRSEVNKLNLVQTQDTEDWYQYLNSGIIYNVHGNDCVLHADSDFDADLCMTTNQQELLDGCVGGLPVTYDKNISPKDIIIDNKLYEADMKAFNTRIGFITNCSTTLYAMLESPEYSLPEKEEIVKRLKICRKEQGNQIDKSKGLFVKPFPVSWTRKVKILDEDNEDTRKQKELSNKILINKRPYFMRWLYSNYGRDYIKYKKAKDTYCLGVFGCSLEEFLMKPKERLDEQENWFLNIYITNNPLLNSDSLMNNICHYMEKTIKVIKDDYLLENDDDLINIIKDESLVVENFHDKANKMFALYEKYRKHKQTLTIVSEDNGEERFKTIEQYNKAIRQQAYSISSNISELANLAIAVCYVMNRDRGFAWNLFGDGIVQNIMKRKQNHLFIPFLNDDGDISYLGSHYSLFEIFMKEDEYVDIV